jgi:hypothetical protein
MLSNSAAPLAKGLPVAASIPVTHTARVDTFIDDLINCFLDAESNRATQPHVVPLAMHCTSRSHTGKGEPITRRDILSNPKLIAEGAPREEQMVLGWMIDTHLLLIKLPRDKHAAWILEVESLRIHRITTHADTDSLVAKTQPRRFPCSPSPPLPDPATIAHESKPTAATTNNGLEERESGLRTLGRVP